MAIQQEVEQFDARLAHWAHQASIGGNLLASPESVHVEAPRGSQNARLQQELARQSLFMAVWQDKWRFTTIARKSGAYILPNFGEINWVEVTESPVKSHPRPTVPRIKAISFYVDDLGAAHTVLKTRKMEPASGDNEISIKLRGTDHEVIFTDVGISYAVEQYVEMGRATQVQL